MTAVLPERRQPRGDFGRAHPGQPRAGDGRYSRQRVTTEATLRRDEIWRRRLLAERAHVERLPGETLQHAIRRIEGGAG